MCILPIYVSVLIVRNKPSASWLSFIFLPHWPYSVHLFGWVWTALGNDIVNWKGKHVTTTCQGPVSCLAGVLLPSKCPHLLWYLPHSLVSHRCPPARGQILLERHLSGEPPIPSLEWQTHTELPAKPSPFFQLLKCLWLHLEPGRTNSIAERLLIYPRTQRIVSCDNWCYFLFSFKYKWTIFDYNNLWGRKQNCVPSSFSLNTTYTLSVFYKMTTVLHWGEGSFGF